MKKGVDMFDNPRITEITKPAQDKIVERPDLLSLNDGVSLAARLVENANQELLNRVIANPDIMSLPTFYGNGGYKLGNGIELRSGFAIAHLVVSLAEKGDDRINEPQLDRITDSRNVLELRDPKDQSVADMMERQQSNGTTKGFQRR